MLVFPECGGFLRINWHIWNLFARRLNTGEKDLHAALTAHYRRMKALGATHMTGGCDPIYEKIGYGKGLHWSFWKKEKQID